MSMTCILEHLAIAIIYLFIIFGMLACMHACAGGGSKDARDMRDMEMEKRLRAGEVESGSWRGLGAFEKYTKVSQQTFFCCSQCTHLEIQPYTT